MKVLLCAQDGDNVVTAVTVLFSASQMDDQVHQLPLITVSRQNVGVLVCKNLIEVAFTIQNLV